MSPSSRVLRLSPELRASIFHFTVFTTSGAASAYLGVWLADKGITPGEIGIINAAPVFALLLINLFVGRLADKASDWRQMIIILSIAAALFPLGLYAVSGFVGIVIIWSLFSVPAGSLPPVVDAATLRMTERNGTSFGNIRGWGTLGSMVATAGTGLLAAWLGPASFVPTLVGLSLARALLSLQLPRFRAPERAKTLPRANTAGRLKEVMKPWFVLPLVAFALVQATHSIIIGFAALVWKEQGISAALIGPLVATSAAAEAVIMFFWRRIGARISARHMILASCIATVLRWSVVAMSPPVWVLFLMQMLHSVTFAMGYLGALHFIANWTSEDIAAEAQSFSFVLQQGVAVVALVLFGWLVASFGAGAFFAAAALGLIGVGLVLLSLKLKPTRETALVPAGAAE
ncbi:MAG TPA: MFS transporter [Devosiaceae bacterium]|jgi:PPP family 3-phenylpropionic acid transporter|nr:MFS transporter [Devosiaceae bacterium]